MAANREQERSRIEAEDSMIYTASNTSKIGKPMRVFVDGKLVSNVVSADTVAGEVVYYPEPISVSNSYLEEVHSKIMRGKVTVEPMS